MEFYDINKLPAKEGLLWFPISMSRISNSQNASHCFDYLSHINPKKISTPKIGVNFCYGDFLYLYSKQTAVELKNKFSPLIINHANACKNIIKKPYYTKENKEDKNFFIEKAFAFDNWNKLYLDGKYDIFGALKKLKKIYEKDSLFQKYIKEDLTFGNKQILSEEQLMFFLEEHLIAYLISKGEIKLHNEYIPNYERVLPCYPGPMLKQHIYLLQKNFFNLKNPKNKYENCRYNLEGKKIYDAEKIDLEKYNYES